MQMQGKYNFPLPLLIGLLVSAGTSGSADLLPPWPSPAEPGSGGPVPSRRAGRPQGNEGDGVLQRSMSLPPPQGRGPVTAHSDPSGRPTREASISPGRSGVTCD